MDLIYEYEARITALDRLVGREAFDSVACLWRIRAIVIIVQTDNLYHSREVS